MCGSVAECLSDICEALDVNSSGKQAPNPNKNRRLKINPGQTMEAWIDMVRWVEKPLDFTFGPVSQAGTH